MVGCKWADKDSNRVILIVIALLAILALTSCVSAEGEMTLYGRGKWEAGFDLTIPREMVSLAGGEASLDASVEEDMEQRGTKAQQNGARFSFEKVRSDDQAIAYHLDLSGNDLESLNAMFEGAGQAHITEGSGGEEYIHLQFMPDRLFASWEGALMSFAFSLNAKEIVSSNANWVEEGTAHWQDLSGRRTAQAVVVGASGGPSGSLLLPVLGSLALLAVIGAAVFLVTRRASVPTPAAAARYCGQCGTSNPADAKFCIGCGASLHG
jgi:hypothetical protein